MTFLIMCNGKTCNVSALPFMAISFEGEPMLACLTKSNALMCHLPLYASITIILNVGSLSSEHFLSLACLIEKGA